MVYKLSSGELIRYVENRLVELTRNAYGIAIERSVDSKGIIIRLNYIKREALIVPQFIEGKPDRIILGIDTSLAGSFDKDFSDFVRNYVNGDVIFQKGKRLYSPERENMLHEWQKVLRRVNSEEGTTACDIIDRNVSTERLRKIFYEYMFRPTLVYLIS